MTAHARRRPGSASPFKLVPDVEEVRTSPVTAPVEVSVPVEVPVPAEPVADQAVAPVAPIPEPAVPVAVESAPPAVAADPVTLMAAPTPEPAAAPVLAAVPALQPEVVAAPDPVVVPVPVPVPVQVESDEKKSVTFGLRMSLKKRAETAVLRTAGYEGGYTSMTALVEGALEREIERLAIEFNNGEPFPRNNGGFRQGRPLGS